MARVVLEGARASAVAKIVRDGLIRHNRAYSGPILMREAERVARKRRAALIWLNTFSFQAPAFYEKLGYRRFAELKNTPASGTARFFYVKRLSGARA